MPRPVRTLCLDVAESGKLVIKERKSESYNDLLLYIRKPNQMNFPKRNKVHLLFSKKTRIMIDIKVLNLDKRNYDSTLMFSFLNFLRRYSFPL